MLPEMSEDIRPVRALPEPPCFHLNGGEKASCRISKKRNRNESCGCVLFLQLAIRQGRTRADFSKQWTPIVLLPEMSEDIRPVRALPEPPCFHLNGGEKASCRISKKRNRNESCGCVFFCNLLSDTGGRGQISQKQWTPIVLLPEMSEDIRPVRALPEPPCFHLNGGEKASCRISKKRNRNESCGCVFFCNLLSDKSHFVISTEARSAERRNLGSSERRGGFATNR